MPPAMAPMLLPQFRQLPSATGTGTETGTGSLTPEERTPSVADNGTPFLRISTSTSGG
ncbi:hypothetical protein SKAU_G00406190 [Synaphobranchus kaupii]|uniref:Uncharacterized protein n=1 Tax=Synaphobranchus kaupii TaxID=118154 RepID=A0A9Q1IC17_SYNKA|nr:hypothetical protein SKAU_G00406190 [Synaphobranchus kaupii]